MKLVILIDNNTLNDQYFLGEPAVSFYIVDGHKRLLFDTGYSEAFVKNAKEMNINIKEIDGIIISHGHEDHSNGLKYYLDRSRNRVISLIAHPLTFNKKKIDNEMICSPYSLEMLSDYFDIEISKEPKKISENIYFLGEIPEYFDFEKRYSMGNIKINGQYTPDYLHDDSAIVYKGRKGLFIITGCSHSGICNIIEHAKKVCNDNRITGVIGGFHLLKNDERLHKTIEYFKKNKIRKIYPCHCTSLIAKALLMEAMPEAVVEVGVGYSINLK